MMALSLLLVPLGSCATCKVDGLWRDDCVVADGNDNEWSGSPQYVDENQRLNILTIAIAEVRCTGIDIGIGRQRGDRLVYEFIIAVKAAPSLCDLKPGMVVGIGILTGTQVQGDPNRIPSAGPMMAAGFSGGLGGPGPGGGWEAVPEDGATGSGASLSKSGSRTGWRNHLLGNARRA